MHLNELKKLIAKGESENLEFKRTTGQRTEAAKTACAMINGAGGIIIFGVDDRGQILGQSVSSKTLEDIATELRRIDPPAFPEIKILSLQKDKEIIIIRVQCEQGVFTFDNKPYLRHGSTTQIMPKSEYERRLITHLHAKRRWENEPAPKTIKLSDLDEEEIHYTFEASIKIGRMEKPKGSKPVDTKSILSGLGLIYDGQLLNAAVVLFGKSRNLYPLYPQLAIKLARFRGNNRLGDFVDNRQYWGNAFELLGKAESFLLDHVPIAGKVIPGKMRREDYPMYPPRATREAIANAICHRDYTNPGATVALAMYNDHLEIINPGRFHFGVTPDKLTQPHQSKPWNPLIADVLYRSGVIERWGTGTLNIIDWCKENGNPTPKWEEQDDSVVVTFFPSQPSLKTQLESQLESRLESQLESNKRGRSLTEKVLDLIEKKGPLSRSELSKGLNQKAVSGQLHQVLKLLLERRLISYTIPEKPNSRFQKYRQSLKNNQTSKS